MRIKKEVVTDTKFKLNLEADQKLLENAKQIVLNKLSRNTKVAGFRSGKAPLALVEKQIDQSLLQSEFADEVINAMYSQAIKEEGLRPITQPKVTLKKFVPYSLLEIEVEVESIGEVILPNYNTIKKAPIKPIVSVDDVKGVINSLRARQAEKIEVKRSVKNGDETVIDFDGVDDKNVPINGGSGKDYPLVIGSSSFIPGFEDELIGMKPKETKDFNIVFPKDYSVSTLRNKKVKFTVTVKNINELKLPALNDEFASKVGPFKTMNELKVDIKKQLLVERENEVQRKYENELIEQIASKSSVSIPETLIEDQVIRAEEEEKRNLTYKGQTWQDHLEIEGVTEDEHRKRQRPDAEKSIKSSLVLSEIARLEGIKVTPEELEIRVQLLKGQYSDDVMRAELDKPENRQDIHSRLMTEKTIAKLVEFASK